MYKIILLSVVAAALALPATASAQSGHFIEGGKSGPTCQDIGTQLQCKGKVAGLGGTVFEITVEAQGTAIVECRNPGGNVAPGQDTEVDVSGSSGPLPTPRNGQYRFTIETDEPTVPNFPTCPNPKWTAEVVDVVFTGDATLTLTEDGQTSDTVTVPISS